MLSVFIECYLYTKNWWGMNRSRTGCMEKRLFYDVTTAGSTKLELGQNRDCFP